MVSVSREDLEKKAREINNMIFGVDRSKKVKLAEAFNIQADLGTKFALENAFLLRGISDQGKKGFVEILKEQKDAVNLLFAKNEHKEKAISMLKPLFGYKSKEFIETFQDIFERLQKEIEADRDKPIAV